MTLSPVNLPFELPNEDRPSRLPSPLANSDDAYSTISAGEFGSVHEGSDPDACTGQEMSSDGLVPASSSPVFSSPTAAVTPPDNDYGGDISSYSFRPIVIEGDGSVGSPGDFSADSDDGLNPCLRTSEACKEQTSLTVSPSSSSVHREYFTNGSINVQSSGDVDGCKSVDDDMAICSPLPSRSEPSFLCRVNDMLLAVQQERRQAEFRQRIVNRPNETGSGTHVHAPATSALNGPSSETSILLGNPDNRSGRTYAVSTLFSPVLYSTSVMASASDSDGTSSSAIVSRSIFSGSTSQSGSTQSVSRPCSLSQSQPYNANSDRDKPISADQSSMDVTVERTYTYAHAGDPEGRHLNVDSLASPASPGEQRKNEATSTEPQASSRPVLGLKRQLSTRGAPPAREVNRSPLNKRKSCAYTHSEESDQYQVERGRKRVRLSMESRFFKRKDSGGLKSKPRQEEPNASMNRAYAKVPASLRRAESLMSEASMYAEEKENLDPRGDADDEAKSSDSTPHDGSSSFASSGKSSNRTPKTFYTPEYHYIPTAPATPATPVQTRRGIRSTRQRSHSRTDDLAAVPIIAPPPFEMIPRGPISAEDSAEQRIAVMLEKERQQREEDRLGARGQRTSGPQADEIVKDGHDERNGADEQVYAWRAGVNAGNPEEAIKVKIEDKYGEESVFSRMPLFSLGIEEGLRREVVEWILDVVPGTYPTKPKFCLHLRDQLTTSEETRFHAAYLFMRYFLRVGSGPESPKARGMDMILLREGREAVTWDVAVACIALCVKFHRDALLPLYIILACEFLSIAPHSISNDDLEASQRDVLQTFSFSIGSITPESYMQELWLALPSLRKLLGFDNGWKVAQTEAWSVLLDALLQEDMLRFPVSLLTASALIDGVVESLARRYMEESFRKVGWLTTSCQCKQFRKKAIKAASGFMLDIQEILGYSAKDLKFCRQWLRSIV
ncbi:hypothetical protein BKA93DRAFT_771786 [Sparassis latifolia]